MLYTFVDERTGREYDIESDIPPTPEQARDFVQTVSRAGWLNQADDYKRALLEDRVGRMNVLARPRAMEASNRINLLESGYNDIKSLLNKQTPFTTSNVVGDMGTAASGLLKGALGTQQWAESAASAVPVAMTRYGGRPLGEDFRDSIYDSITMRSPTEFGDIYSGWGMSENASRAAGLITAGGMPGPQQIARRALSRVGIGAQRLARAGAARSATPVLTSLSRIDPDAVAAGLSKDFGQISLRGSKKAIETQADEVVATAYKKAISHKRQLGKAIDDVLQPVRGQRVSMDTRVLGRVEDTLRKSDLVYVDIKGDYRLTDKKAVQPIVDIVKKIRTRQAQGPRLTRPGSKAVAQPLMSAQSGTAQFTVDELRSFRNTLEDVIVQAKAAGDGATIKATKAFKEVIEEPLEAIPGWSAAKGRYKAFMDVWEGGESGVPFSAEAMLHKDPSSLTTAPATEMFKRTGGVESSIKALDNLLPEGSKIYGDISNAAVRKAFGAWTPATAFSLLGGATVLRTPQSWPFVAGALAAATPRVAGLAYKGLFTALRTGKGPKGKAALDMLNRGLIAPGVMQAARQKQLQ